MPAGDRTGPEGQGPLTGRRMGNCTTNNVSDSRFFGGFGRGGGRGLGRGFRRGIGNFNNPTPQYSSDNETLKNEINALKEQLSFLENKLSESQNKD